MKTNTELQLNLNQIRITWFKKFIYLITFLLFFSFTKTSAQEGKSINIEKNRITERKNIISKLQESEQSSNNTYSKSKHLENLLSKVQPSVYFYSGTLKTYGEEPVCLFTNIQSLQIITDEQFSKDEIEMLTIRIENEIDLNSKIDLSLFSTFESLRYIQIISTIPTTENIISNMITNDDEKYILFFKIEKGDSE